MDPTPDDPPRRPFRWRRLLTWTIVLLLGGFLIVSALLPGLDSGPGRRIVRERSVCEGHLAAIGVALRSYVGQFGAYPPTFGPLLATQRLTPDQFVCPSAARVTPATGATAADVTAAVADPTGAHCSYVYVAAGLDPASAESTGADGDDVVAFESTANHDLGDDRLTGFHVLLASGYADWQSCACGKPDALVYDHLIADYAAGIRPLRIRP